MAKITVDQEKCIGCGACVAVAPELFDLNQEGKSQAKKKDDLNAEETEKAAQTCPVGAIKVE